MVTTKVRYRPLLDEKLDEYDEDEFGEEEGEDTFNNSDEEKEEEQ